MPQLRFLGRSGSAEPGTPVIRPGQFGRVQAGSDPDGLGLSEPNPVSSAPDPFKAQSFHPFGLTVYVWLRGGL